MGVPEEIRKVPRPTNTVVLDNGGDGPKRYAVRERSSTKYVPGGNPQPRNGRVIGHIIDGVFVPVKEEPQAEELQMLSYGAAALVNSVSQDLLADLRDVFPIQEAHSIMAIAALRVIKPGISLSRLASACQRSFVRVFYPGAVLSSDSVSELLENIGMDEEKRREFFQKRMRAAAKAHHIFIDSTLKRNNSQVNDLMDFSCRERVEDSRDISILYAYSFETMEPLCVGVFPGDSIDATSCSTFIRDNDICRGTVILDKGFGPGSIANELKERPQLHYLTPVKPGDTRIRTYDMLNYEGVFKDQENLVLYKKGTLENGHFLYALKDAEQAIVEESRYLASVEDGEEFDKEAYAKKRNTFGVAVFESDQDLPPAVLYRSYKDRWRLEHVFQQHTNDLELTKTNAKGVFTIIGSEFINFIATIASARILKKAGGLGLLKKLSYGDLMDDLASAWRRADAPIEAKSDDEYWVHTDDLVMEELELLGLSVPVLRPEPKKRGRPRKNSDVSEPRRPRGRPRKNPESNDAP
ncbi:MAG: transposase [Bacillota bacterium]|nr:transposase [Bacillota bacterium]